MRAPAATVPRAASFHLALAHTGLGDFDRAFALLDRGLDEQGSFMVGMPVEPAFAALHGDPRWAALLRRVRLTNVGE